MNVADPSGEELLVVVSVVDVAGRCGFVESCISVLSVTDLERHQGKSMLLFWILLEIIIITL